MRSTKLLLPLMALAMSFAGTSNAYAESSVGGQSASARLGFRIVVVPNVHMKAEGQRLTLGAALPNRNGQIIISTARASGRGERQQFQQQTVALSNRPLNHVVSPCAADSADTDGRCASVVTVASP